MFQSAIMIYLWGSSSISSANGEKLFLLIEPFLEKSHVSIPLPALLLVRRKCPVEASLLWRRETFSSLLNTNVELVLRKWVKIVVKRLRVTLFDTVSAAYSHAMLI